MDYEALKINIGRVVRSERHRRGYGSQEEFSEAVGTHKNYLGAIERGERNVSLYLLVRIADGLDMPLSRLITEAEDLPAPKR
jgi:transcriptional regulator with XRE-family HTH domain